MRIVIDIEANGLINPTKIWLVVCKDIDTGELYVFRNVSENEEERVRFNTFKDSVTTWIGHNVLEYDFPVMARLLSTPIRVFTDRAFDTLVVSKLTNFSRKGGHSIESYGEEFGLSKGKFNDWSKYSQEMEDYCVRDVEITHLLYLRLSDHNDLNELDNAIRLEQRFNQVASGLTDTGFFFDSPSARKLLAQVVSELGEYDEKIKSAFPPLLKATRQITPRYTKYGTLNKSDFRWVRGGDIAGELGEVVGPFTRCEWTSFNPNSHKQIVEVLHTAGWSPTDRTAVHIETQREVDRLKYLDKSNWDVDLRNHYDILLDKLESLKKTGWKVNEDNLSTLPSNAPPPARMLAKRILLESRRRSLTEWLALVSPDDGRIHGSFYGIGAWTHRMSHQKPNTANIPNEYRTNGTKALLGREMRSLWRAAPGKLLVGVDAEGIQLRIFAHYIDDKEFTEALVKGKKDDHTDPHSLNQRVLGTVCKSRQAAKRFIYALLLGAGLAKLAEVLECSRDEAQSALNRLMERYKGFDYLKRSVIPADARRGYFQGLDGRLVPIPGETMGQRRHLCMSGYLQNGEAVVIKMSAIEIAEAYEKFGEVYGERRGFAQAKDASPKLVGIIHDEFQSEVYDPTSDRRIAKQVAQIKADAIKHAGKKLKLRIPLAGSYMNDHGEYSIGETWADTH